MSKLLTGLMEAERRRRALAADEPRPPAGEAPPANVRGESAAVAGIMPGFADVDGAALALRNRVEQDLALAQAAATRLEAERAVVVSLDRRLEDEASALAKAQREERRAAELAAAAAARAAKERELARLSEARGAAERCAADRAVALLAAERAATAALQARIAAEEEAVRETRRRIAQEGEASRAAAERRRMEHVIRVGQAQRAGAGSSEPVPGQAGEPDGSAPGQPLVDLAQEVGQPRNGSVRVGRRLMAVVLLSIVLVGTGGYWLGRLGAPRPLAQSIAAPPQEAAREAGNPPAADDGATHLRLDTSLRTVPSRTAGAPAGDP